MSLKPDRKPDTENNKGPQADCSFDQNRDANTPVIQSSKTRPVVNVTAVQALTSRSSTKDGLFSTAIRVKASAILAQAFSLSLRTGELESSRPFLTISTRVYLLSSDSLLLTSDFSSPFPLLSSFNDFSTADTSAQARKNHPNSSQR